MLAGGGSELCGHSVALTESGRCFSWGNGSDGRLGLGGTSTTVTPRAVTALEGHVVTAAACGAAHTCVATADGKVFAFGDGTMGQLGNGAMDWSLLPERVAGALQNEKALQLACGHAHSAAVTIGGRLYTWGDGDNGQLGHADVATERKTVPAQVRGLPTGLRVLSVACGAFFTAAASEDGQLFAWGNNAFGQLGIGSTESRRHPTRVSLPRPVRRVACGACHMAVVLAPQPEEKESCRRRSEALSCCPSQADAGGEDASGRGGGRGAHVDDDEGRIWGKGETEGEGCVLWLWGTLPPSQSPSLSPRAKHASWSKPAPARDSLAVSFPLHPKP